MEYLQNWLGKPKDAHFVSIKHPTAGRCDCPCAAEWTTKEMSKMRPASSHCSQQCCRRRKSTSSLAKLGTDARCRGPTGFAVAGQPLALPLSWALSLALHGSSLALTLTDDGLVWASTSQVAGRSQGFPFCSLHSKFLRAKLQHCFAK